MRVGLIADTHIPYRAPAFPAAVLEALRGVDLILHAGDVDEPWALAPLRALAPVYAVRGNYHIFDGSTGGAGLPATVELTLGEFRVALAHGDLKGLWGLYWRGRLVWRYFLLRQWEFPALYTAMVRQLLRRFPHADVIVFGHTHRPYAQWWGHTLVVNPGAALPTSYFVSLRPSVAHLILEPGQKPEVVWLTHLESQAD